MKYNNEWAFVKVLSSGTINLYEWYTYHGNGPELHFLIQTDRKEPMMIDRLQWKKGVKEYLRQNKIASDILNKTKLKFKTFPELLNRINHLIRSSK